VIERKVNFSDLSGVGLQNPHVKNEKIVTKLLTNSNICRICLMTQNAIKKGDREKRRKHEIQGE
jgi:hypothetical protein